MKKSTRELLSALEAREAQARTQVNSAAITPTRLQGFERAQLIERLERVERDLEALSKAHAAHRHPVLDDAYKATGAPYIGEARTTPEVLTPEQQDARSWKILNDWRNAGGEQGNHEAERIVNVRGNEKRGGVVLWDGVSKVYDGTLNNGMRHAHGRTEGRTMHDALAHAAQWCLSEMELDDHEQDGPVSE